MGHAEFEDRIIDRVAAEQNLARIFSEASDSQVVALHQMLLEEGLMRPAGRKLGLTSRAVDDVVERVRRNFSEKIKRWDGGE